MSNFYMIRIEPVNSALIFRWDAYFVNPSAPAWTSAITKHNGGIWIAGGWGTEGLDRFVNYQCEEVTANAFGVTEETFLGAVGGLA